MRVARCEKSFQAHRSLDGTYLVDGGRCFSRALIRFLKPLSIVGLTAHDPNQRHRMWGEKSRNTVDGHDGRSRASPYVLRIKVSALC